MNGHDFDESPATSPDDMNLALLLESVLQAGAADVQDDPDPECVELLAAMRRCVSDLGLLLAEVHTTELMLQGLADRMMNQGCGDIALKLRSRLERLMVARVTVGVVR